MRRLKKYTIILISLSIISYVSTYYFENIFIPILHQEYIDISKDTYVAQELNELYSMACIEKVHKLSGECQGLSKNIKKVEYRINNNYKYITFYFKYIK